VATARLFLSSHISQIQIIIIITLHSGIFPVKQ